MFTLSQMVDELVSETKRPDMLNDIVRFVNQTVREAHFSGDRRAALLFKANFRELELTSNSETGFSWDVPNPAIFQHMAAVQYPGVFDFEGKVLWAKELQPGRAMNEQEHYYYRVGDTFVFSGYGGAGKTINIGYYEFPPSLKYYAEADRPATYDPEIGWSYHNDYDDTDELKAEARLKVSNWILLRWSDVISEGVRAKLFKRLSDTERARTSYSMYESLRQGLWTSETMVTYQG